jgi:Domain of unknown function (DUF4314)
MPADRPLAVEFGAVRRRSATSAEAPAILPSRGSPPGPENTLGGVKARAVETDKPPMDPTGARLLAARIRAGVSVGTRIELVVDVDAPGLTAGDRGVVQDIDDTGLVRVAWDRGCVVEIDPEHTPFRPLAA